MAIFTDVYGEWRNQPQEKMVKTVREKVCLAPNSLHNLPKDFCVHGGVFNGVVWVLIIWDG